MGEPQVQGMGVARVPTGFIKNLVFHPGGRAFAGRSALIGELRHSVSPCSD